MEPGYLGSTLFSEDLHGHCNDPVAKLALPRRIRQVIPTKKSMFPLAINYDADIHDALASMRILDGTLPLHSKYGAPVNFFVFCSSARCKLLCQTEYSGAWVSAL